MFEVVAPDMRDELDRLATIAAAGDRVYAQGVNETSTRYSAAIFARHWHGARCLELGPAEGTMTPLLLDAFAHVDVVEGSLDLAERLARRHPDLGVHACLFEQFEPSERYDAIVLGHVLEHVDDPIALLGRARSWLAHGGRVFVSVPHAGSLHRRAAVRMGLLEFEAQLNERDREVGHRRVYSRWELERDVRAAGLQVEFNGGYWLKPVSNAQIDADWAPEMVDAYMELGEHHPDLAAELYVVASAAP